MDHVGDTTSDNASSTKPKTLVDCIEDARILAEDKCRTVRSLRRATTSARDDHPDKRPAAGVPGESPAGFRG